MVKVVIVTPLSQEIRVYSGTCEVQAPREFRQEGYKGPVALPGFKLLAPPTPLGTLSYTGENSTLDQDELNEQTQGSVLIVHKECFASEDRKHHTFLSPVGTSFEPNAGIAGLTTQKGRQIIPAPAFMFTGAHWTLGEALVPPSDDPDAAPAMCRARFLEHCKAFERGAHEYVNQENLGPSNLLLVARTPLGFTNSLIHGTCRSIRMLLKYYNLECEQSSQAA
jgi:hypothetical protein